MTGVAARRRLLAATIVTVLVAGPAIALAATTMWSSDQLAGVAEAPTAVEVRADATTVARDRSVPLTMTWDDGQKLRALNAAGLVTAVHVAAGDVVEEGAPVIDVDGQPLIGMSGPTPPWRDLARGDKGPDVGNLNRFLRSVGALATQPDDPARFTSLTADAVAHWRADVGLADGEVFERSAIVWLPQSATTIGSVEVAPATPLEGAGQAVAVSRPTLAAASIPPPQDPAVVTALTVQGETVDIDVATGQLTSTGLTAVAGIVVPDTATVDAEIRFEPVSGVRVPISAVVDDGTGTCVLVADGEQWVPTAVEVGPGEPGVLVATRGIAEGARILANPAEMSPEVTCSTSVG